MSLPSVTEQPTVEEKRENKLWSPEEKKLFYAGFSKHYRRFNQIAEMVILFRNYYFIM